MALNAQKISLLRNRLLERRSVQKKGRIAKDGIDVSATEN